MLDTIENSRNFIENEANAKLDLACLELQNRLTKLDGHYEGLQQDVALQIETFTLPFKNQELEWTSHDGKQSGTTVLSARMKKFEKTIEAAERELDVYQTDWLAVTQEILDLASERIGTACLDQWLAGNLDDDSLLRCLHKEMEVELANEKNNLLAQIGELEKESMMKMEESEKVFPIFACFLCCVLTTFF